MTQEQEGEREKMKEKKAYVLVYCATIVLVVCITSAASAQTRKNTGRVIFMERCAACHAPNGKGNLNVIAMVNGDISRIDLTDETTAKKQDVDLRSTILDGRGLMPAHKDKLTAVEVDHVLKFIRQLGKKRK
ncbi:MAG: hypothetical protein A3B91_00595 [Candidatus Yanofskybacteria bacterium RIFCSPHIGHO2_02_FULL_41_29]|uniref:Cytochrome c domain-containing protein n=1 Tax=Candidatus Yanofskybacteria bacterium RIFCSPHIGHO2_01_FULL_41_53 TaxID=1802663 RepID=A0A1F8EJE2_9BACT|nr:MAG: hypothetical protein A2650_03380 [Candidatus Yanofskybacteria bacterium RIFCSPHIGHO2_01_FULL_41_53]OGN12171.1 MAG: hypothetical protein A3B91_00595 [Candidatus Yanofskybacteria bacterium RIFCSPHIGHO2_02_FULL_41_29]OGN17970.1 MAG: hypothetical protein A3F48_04685 [Candidatus Yanofskybacteria bacterium RIFCSPHIGHO2_12_FULL_41_9]OGN23672.1 MAG: hypothetical protein A2916_03690 [Candidatus Yanofskybacteria bacterium RIFCSPLOWO2_01_FULL_41_67]OGN29230.1 MAG: hypothetical protein A3H54_03575 